jgi:DNA repair protein RecN (Recombination protein N)
MPAVAFEVEFTALELPGPVGQENAQFLFSPNPGRSPSPLAETASGGELSRVMLALVSILSRYQRQPTLIFDEIDAGLGGRTAEAVAERLLALARRVQVLCVTHLPAVASVGSGHYVVEKVSDAGSTSVTVKAVKKEERVVEIARMLSGDASPKTARKLATDLLRGKRDA